MISTKFQIPNPKQISVPQIQNSKQSCFGHWILRFGIYLEIGIWDLWFWSGVFKFRLILLMTF
jgi:hypothetical protein